MVLIDDERGVLTGCESFTSNSRYQIKDTVKHARISDVLKVHDYNYLKKVIDIS